MDFEITDELLDGIAIAMEDDAFVAKIANARDANAIISLFSDKGITINEEIAKSAYDKIMQIRNGDELSEEDLQLVAGGKTSWKKFKQNVKSGFKAGRAEANNVFDKHGINGWTVATAGVCIAVGVGIGVYAGLGGKT